ncbi:hypothetical protein OG948_46280 (plasmid) [Embleya sp. NBC_00888]|uniref:hypothetical protein n=1 Tax=Embleya sp. NBC_00888 TaxID=2975960 RepID=UPI002F908265|nr:hypothetical protein OG948_46280 [Embleya sp. NBC_00888]
MRQQWPEGPEADPVAARERYDRDMRASRGALREVFRADTRDAHFGLGLVLVAGVVAAFVGGLVVGALVVAAFATLFVLTLTAVLVRGIRGSEAGRRAYRFTFGWSQWF